MGRKIDDVDPIWAFPDCNSRLNLQIATEWYTKFFAQKTSFEVIHQIPRLHGLKIDDGPPIEAIPDDNSNLNSKMAMKCHT